ncbi:MAG: cyanophycin synthetase [Desulfobulbaceae bacterium]|nr:cyanophycin synthetase [Desulfobulbaceae bacterium]
MESLKRMLYAWIERKFLAGCSNYNSLATRKGCRSKKLAREMFAQHAIPHARGRIFYGLLAPLRFARKFGFPLVVKPNVGGFSRGSHFPIRSYGQLLKAAILVKIWWPSSVVEQYLEGKNYRILVARDQVISVIRRYPPFVVGDGVSTIEELIDRENLIRERLHLHPVIHPIAKNRRMQSFLQKKGKHLSSFPEQGETVLLHNRIALAAGGVVDTVDQKSIHPDNLQLFLKIPDLFDANVLGVDAIFQDDIETSYRSQKAIFLEVNSRPYLKMHDFPRYGTKDHIQKYLQKFAGLDIAGKDMF